MGRFSWLLLLIGILQGWSQTQSRAGGRSSEETHTAVSSSLILSSIPQPHTPPTVPPLHVAQLFKCDRQITLAQCRQEVIKLKPVLEKYGASQLGEWKWVLVSSQEWEVVLASRGFSPNVTALTALAVRTTFFDETLIEGSTGRLSQLMNAWHMSRNGLLDLAVRHELGHAFCRDDNEQRAVRNEGLLDENQPPVCGSLRTPDR